MLQSTMRQSAAWKTSSVCNFGADAVTTDSALTGGMGNSFAMDTPTAMIVRGAPMRFAPFTICFHNTPRFAPKQTAQSTGAARELRQAYSFLKARSHVRDSYRFDFSHSSSSNSETSQGRVRLPSMGQRFGRTEPTSPLYVTSSRGVRFCDRNSPLTRLAERKPMS